MSARDPFNLQRFIEAQEGIFEKALGEVRAGKKQSHWMWFVFPQLRGLGRSSTARHYGIRGREEALAYLRHPLLGQRLREVAEAACSLATDDARAVFGFPDELKLRSSATLFAAVGEPDSVFARLLEHYFAGVADSRTVALLGEAQTPTEGVRAT
ncbi:MAG: DUF1810 domain-containing protein [Pseudomonadota bacterium]